MPALPQSPESPTDFGSVRYGGDYNPEQWSAPVWEEDYAAFEKARLNTVSLGIFAWSHLQPAEDRYDFTLLDQIVTRAVDGQKDIVLATATGAMPPWLAHAYPEVNRTDFEGREHTYGQRHNHCPSSPVFRQFSAELAGRIAQRYTGTPGLIAWHVGNEYGGPDGSCYCPRCAAGFRSWLQERYTSLDALNAAWNTTFWSHRYTQWEQIQVPNALSEHWRGPNHTAFQGITLDYRRFMTDALLQNYVDEKARIRAYDSRTPVTTNFMGAFRPLDYHRWADHLDLVSWDNYPPGRHEHVRMAFTHDLMRGLKDGAPTWVMEQTPTITAARDVNPVKRPGVLALWSWQAVAHGADAVLYFQLRASRGACEKYHGAVLDHAGRTDSRPFREVTALGKDLERAGQALLAGRTRSRVALLFDWDNWWACEITDGFNRHVRYLDTVLGYYRALWRAQAAVDVVPIDADLSRYDVVLAPLLHLLKGDIAERLRAVTDRGGSVLTTFWAGRVDEHTNAYLMDAPGPLAELFGVRVEEVDSAEPGLTNPITLTLGDRQVDSGAELVMELLVPTGAEVVGTYGADFYAGTPAITRHRTGDGAGLAWYVGAGLEQDGVDVLIGQILDTHELHGPYAGVAEGLEYTEREGPGGRISYLLNHSEEPVSLILHASGTDLRTGAHLRAGEDVTLAVAEVLVWKHYSAD